MKITCSQIDLKTNLSLVSRVVPSRPTHPVLSNVLLEADEDSGVVNLTGFDLSLGIRTSLNAQIEEGGSITIPAKLINDIVSRLPEGEITLSQPDDEDEIEAMLEIISASGKFQVRGIGAEEYPELPVIKDGETLTLPIEALAEGLKGAAFAASTDDSKQVLTGVHLIGSKDSLEFAATDGHRLSVVQTSTEITHDKAEEGEKQEETEIINLTDFEATIPARALRELEKMLSTNPSNEKLILHVNESQVVFELGRQRLTSRKLEGAYPNYRQLIPRDFKRQMTVNRKRLINALELVAVLADQKNNLVKFTIDREEEQLSLSIDAQDIGKATQSLPAEVTGDSMEIGFNVKYLMDGLKALPAEEIVMHLNEANQPVIFTPLAGVKMTYLVMPVQLK